MRASFWVCLYRRCVCVKVLTRLQGHWHLAAVAEPMEKNTASQDMPTSKEKLKWASTASLLSKLLTVWKAVSSSKPHCLCHLIQMFKVCRKVEQEFTVKLDLPQERPEAE